MALPLSEYLDQAREAGAKDAAARKLDEKLDDPGISRTDDALTATLRPGESLEDLDALIRKRGLDPSDWKVVSTTVNEWESGALVNGEWTTITLHQLKVLMKPSFNMVKPARIDGPNLAPLISVERVGGSRLVVQLPDQQAPYHDQALHELVCEWLHRNRPDTVVLSGDLFDFPSISKHRTNRRMHTTAQKSIDAGYTIVRDYRQACPFAAFVLVPGNHEIRLENFLVDRDAEEIAELRRAGDPQGKPLLSLGYVARLDELGVEVMESEYSGYPHPHYRMTDDFDIWHGWVVRPEAGASALATIRKTGRSAGVGHTHRAGIVSLNDPARKLIGVEAGTLAKVEGGLGYEVAPNWENGFAVYRVHQNGAVHPSLAYYRGGALFHGEQYYERTAAGTKVTEVKQS